MHRLKNTSHPLPRPPGSILAGMLIGATIMTIATQAIALGAGSAIQNGSWRGG